MEETILPPEIVKQELETLKEIIQTLNNEQVIISFSDFGKDDFHYDIIIIDNYCNLRYICHYQFDFIWDGDVLIYPLEKLNQENIIKKENVIRFVE